ncbi:MAG: hypothetical protein IH855_04875 [Bacteroidetes bacterium]|nr:hypothetical protein [Bacteroidota bacterium]
MSPFNPVSSSSSPTTSSKPVAEIQRSARLLADGKAAEAVRRLEALSAAVPAYATSQVLLAKAYEAEQRSEDALEAWHRAHFLAPGSPLVQRERRRRLEAKARAAEVASPPELPPEPPSEHPKNRGAEEVDAEDVGGPGEPDEVVANEMVEPVEDQVEEQPETTPDEALLNAARHDAAEPFDSEELAEDLLERTRPEVFADDSAPVSDALGTADATEIWEDDALDADAHSPVVEEPFVAAPTSETETAEPMAGAPGGEAAWWKSSEDFQSEADVEDVDTGWTVVSETETARTEGAVMEAQIVAPMDEAAPEARTEAEGVADTHAVGADATLADDLDSLIRELEDAPRIRLNPNFIGEDEEEGFDDEIADDMVSETLARIYVAQGQFGEAASVYETLADQHPERAEEFLEKAADVRARVGGGT